MGYRVTRKPDSWLIPDVSISYLDQAGVAPLLELSARVGRMLNGLMRALNQRLATDPIPDPRPPMPT